MRSRARRRSVSIWDSPGPRVPMPPSMRPAPRRSRCVHSPRMRARLYSSWASSTWSLPSAVWAWSAKMSRMIAVRSMTGTPSAVLQVALLTGRELVVAGDQVGVAGLDRALELVELARAQVGVGVGLVAVLDELARHGHPGRAQELAQLGEVLLAVLGHLDHQARCRARSTFVSVGSMAAPRAHGWTTPALRRQHDATVWVETDQPCEVEVLGRRARTFAVCGHHYALVVHRGPRARRPTTPTRSRSTATRPGPTPTRRRSRRRPSAPARATTTTCASPSARAAWPMPHERPFIAAQGRRQARPRGRRAVRPRPAHAPAGPRPLARPPALARRPGLRGRDLARRTRVHRRPPADGAQRPPDRRGRRLRGVHPALLGVVARPGDPVAALDGAQRDDLRRPRRARRLEHVGGVGRRRSARKPWWHERIVGAYMSYWVYQHLGNLSPGRARGGRDLAPGRASGRGRDRAPARAAPSAPSDGTTGTRWSYCRDFGRTRLIVMDSRAGRVLDAATRTMVDDDEWRVDRREGHRRLRPPAARHVAALPARPRDPPPGGVERGGVRRRLGRPGARSWARSMRQGLDLEHWAAFNDSFRKLTS